MKLSGENEWIRSVLMGFLSRSSLSSSSASFSRELYWDAVLKVIQYQGLTPIVYHVLSREGRLEDIPHNQRDTIREEYLGHVAHVLLYETFLAELTAAFGTADIPFLIIKGPAMAHEFYDPAEIRFYSDIDLVIRERDYDRAREVICALGMRVEKPEREAIRRKYFNSVSFSKPGPPEIMLDLHWETLVTSWNPESFLGSPEIWDRIRWITAPGFRLPVLDPDMLVIHSCLHLSFHHQFGNLLTLCDLVLVLQKFRSQIDWDRVAERCRAMGVRKAVHWALWLAGSLFGAGIPEGVLSHFKRRGMERYFMRMEPLLFRKERLSVHTERAIKFFLIDDPGGKIRSLSAFLAQK
jgi:hypothetical protein